MRRNLVAAVALVAGSVLIVSPASATRRDWPNVREWNRICNTTSPVPNPATGEHADYAEGANCRLVRVDGVLRHFVAYVPKSVAQSAAPAPVVLMFHGTSGTGEEFYDRSRWREIADRDGLIAVFPTARAYRLIDSPGRFTTKWTHYAFPCDVLPLQNTVDDINYIDDVLRNIGASEQVDVHRVYASGFSAGSQMVNRLALERNGVFAAAAGSSGFLQECRFTTVPVNPGIPLFTQVGSVDDRYVDETQYVPADAVAVDSHFSRQIDQTVAAHGLDRTAWTEIDFAAWNGWTPPEPTWPAATWTLLEFATPAAGSNNTTGNRVVFGVIQELDHTWAAAWPGLNNPRLETSQWTAMADVHWTFFQQHVRP